MKKNILGLTLLLTANITLANEAGFKSRVYSAVAKGLDTTKTLVGSGYEISRNAVSKVPGTTFLGNNKLNIFFATAGVYAAAEVYNFKKGKELYTTKAFNWSAQTRAGQCIKNAWNTSTAWLLEKYHAWILQLNDFKAQVEVLKKDIAEARAYDPKLVATKEEVKALQETVKALQETAKALAEDVSGYDVSMANARRDLNKLLETSVSRPELTKSQEANIEAFATKKDLSDLFNQIQSFNDALTKIAATLRQKTEEKTEVVTPVQSVETSTDSNAGN